MDLGLKGLKALVTGASQGLGYAIALGLAGEGAQVAVNSRSAENLANAAKAIQKETGAGVHVEVGDLGSAETAAQVVDNAAKALGGLDLLLTNTGGPPSSAFESLDEDAWQGALDLVFNAHRRLIKAALPYLRRSQHPSVLTLTSISVKQPIANLVLSNAGRAATVGLTKTLAFELGGEGIRFNSILPGWTETDRVIELMEARAKDNHSTVEAEIAAQAAAAPLGRMGSPEEIANVAVFLLSPAASYINGVMLNVDGGSYRGLL